MCLASPSLPNGPTPHPPALTSPRAHPPNRARPRPRLCRARRPRVAVSGAARVPSSTRPGAGPATPRRHQRGADRAGDGGRNEAGGVVLGACTGRGAACCAPTPVPRPAVVLRQRREHCDHLADPAGLPAARRGAARRRLSRLRRKRRRTTEAGLYRAADAAYTALAARPEVDPRRIYVYGRSLGSAAATYTATRHLVSGLILESPFTNAADMARDAYRILPRFILRVSLDNLGCMNQVHCPVLVFHGTADRLVPIAMGRQVAAAAAGPVEFVLVEGSGHNETYDLGGKQYRDKVWAFVAGPATPRHP